MMMFGNMKSVKTVATLLAICFSVTQATVLKCSDLIKGDKIRLTYREGKTWTVQPVYLKSGGSLRQYWKRQKNEGVMDVTTKRYNTVVGIVVGTDDKTIHVKATLVYKVNYTDGAVDGPYSYTLITKHPKKDIGSISEISGNTISKRVEEIRFFKKIQPREKNET